MIFEKVIEVIVDQMTVEASSITPETSFVSDLGADSLDIFRLVTELEEFYEIEFEPTELTNMKTVADVVSYIENAVDKG